MMDIKEIMSIIPHRPPFLLIDRVEEIVEGEKIVAIKNVTMNEPFFVGHYPGEPVMPGVLIVEAMAQAGVPGDCLKLEVTFTKLRGNAGIGKGIAYVDGKKAAEAELTFMIG